MKFQLWLVAFTLFCISATASTKSAPYPKIIDQSALNEQMNPCDNFYEFSCGAWLKKTVIPNDKKSVYRQSTPMLDSVDLRLNAILSAYARGEYKVPATYATKLASFYSSCMAAPENASQALALLRGKVQRIESVKSAADFAHLIAKFQQQGIHLFHLYSMQDFNDSSVVLADIAQAGMVLVNPAYYLEQDDKSKEIRVKYTEYVQELFVLLGKNPLEARAISGRILKFETKLAEKAYSVTDQSDPDKINHVMTLAEVQKLMPGFDWKTHLQTVGLSTNKFNVEQPEFLQNLDAQLATLPVSERNEYLTWLLLDRSAKHMGTDFEKAHFGFWDAYMNGTKSMLPRWKLCTQATQENLGYALAEAYVKTFDGAAILDKTNSMIDEVKTAFVEDLQLLSTGVDAWIDGATLKEAVAKAQSIERKVGGPTTFRNYDALQLSPTNYLENSFAVSVFESRRDLAKVGKPVDKSEWGMMPWEVNAYYDRSNNEFVFPFGILQPPSLDLKASDGANYGAFGGSTIGHELMHGFDSAGSKYDQHGNLKDWWTPDTQKAFDEKAQCYAKQASQYKIKSVDMFVNGEQTLEENLADQGGVKLGYMVLEKILRTRPESTPWLGKYSERQQFWIAYAQSWCAKFTDEALRSRMTNDVHPPSEFRVNAVMMNQPEFARDFQCTPGQPMSPVNRCSLW